MPARDLASFRQLDLLPDQSTASHLKQRQTGGLLASRLAAKVMGILQRGQTGMELERGINSTESPFWPLTDWIGRLLANKLAVRACYVRDRSNGDFGGQSFRVFD